MPFDNKLSPTETLNALRSAADQGIRYIVLGGGSAAALAMVGAVEKYNARNPGKELLYLNYAAVDPDLADSKCSYWHRSPAPAGAVRDGVAEGGRQAQLPDDAP